MDKDVPIIEGPDKWGLLAGFGSRTPVEFKTEDDIFAGYIHSIEHEDGSGLSFNLRVSIDHVVFSMYYHAGRRKGRLLSRKN